MLHGLLRGLTIFVAVVNLYWFLSLNLDFNIYGSFSNSVAKRLFRTIPKPNFIETYYLTFKWNKDMGLGNSMFMYASTYAIARNNNKTAFILGPNFNLDSVFSITMIHMNTTNFKTTEFVFPQSGMYFDGFEHLPQDKHIIIHSYLQSFKYFEQVENDIRNEFTFLQQIKVSCSQTLESVYKTYNNSTKDSSILRNNTECLLIGAHMRRGDFVDEKKQLYGHKPATKEYLTTAVHHLRQKFSEHCLIFIILGNDYKWNIENSPVSNDVIVLKPQTAGVDLCILSSCDHSIVSAGSFGWWAAWLANGYTVYDKHQSRPNSTLSQKYDKNYTSYIPSHWVPL